MNKDIVFITVPKFEVQSPLIGPAALKAVVEKAGYTSKCFDFNVELWNKVKDKYAHCWLENDQTLIKDKKFKEIRKDFDPLIADCVQQIKLHSPKFVGVTLLSHWQHTMTTAFIDEMLRVMPDVKIVLGGPGATPDYGPKNLKEGRIYAYVEAEGEEAILQILKGNRLYPGINGQPPVQIQDLDSLPFADYTDYDMSQYSHLFRDPFQDPKGTDLLYLTGSRGCIRRCKFCDVGKRWPTFASKSGVTIAKEMIHQVKTHPEIKEFYFTDSLLNGNIPQMNAMMDTLIEANLEGVRWGGQFIVRPPNSQGPEIYEKLAKSGCNRMLLGIESGSQKVLNSMKKGARAVDIDYTLEQCSKNGMDTVMMMLIGYPGEGEEEFQETMDMFTRNAKYAKDGTVFQISLGATMRVYPGTPLFEQFQDMGIDYDDVGAWEIGDNTQKVRIERWFRLRNHCRDLGYQFALDSPTFLVERYQKITGKDIRDIYGE